MLLLSITFGVRVNPGIHQVNVLPLVSGVVFIAGSLRIQSLASETTCTLKRLDGKQKTHQIFLRFIDMIC